MRSTHTFYKEQWGSMSIQWMITALALLFILFKSIKNEKSSTDMVEDAIKAQYEDQLFSGSLP